MRLEANHRTPLGPLPVNPAQPASTRPRTGPTHGAENRARFRALIRAQPGLGFRAIVRASGLASGTCRYHLTRLLRAGLVVERRHGGRLYHFPRGHAADGAALARTSPELARLLDFLQTASAPLDQRQILRGFPGWPRATTQHRLARLVKFGAVAVQCRDRRRFYRLLAE